MTWGLLLTIVCVVVFVVVPAYTALGSLVGKVLRRRGRADTRPAPPPDGR